MHLYALCQTRLNLKMHTVSGTENRTSCLTTLVRQSQSMAVSQRPVISVGMEWRGWGWGGGGGGGGLGVPKHMCCKKNFLTKLQ